MKGEAAKPPLFVGTGIIRQRTCPLSPFPLGEVDSPKGEDG